LAGKSGKDQKLTPQQIEDRVDCLMQAATGVSSLDDIRNSLKDLQRCLPQLTRRMKDDVIRSWGVALKPSGLIPFSHLRSFYFSLLKDETVPFHRNQAAWIEFIRAIEPRYQQEFQQLMDQALNSNRIVFVTLKFRLKIIFSNAADALRFTQNGDVLTEVNPRLERIGDRVVADHSSPVYRLQRGKTYLLEGEGIGGRLENFSHKLPPSDFSFEEF
jgi:hypothetical protein